MEQEFSDILKEWRISHGMTQLEAAVYLDVSLRTLHAWERKTAKPDHIKSMRALMNKKRKSRK
jgi:DNA-binding transcriptional regulator YiaG